MSNITPEIISALKKGDYKSFSGIYSSLSPKVYNFIYSIVRDRADSEDILQKSFLALWESRDKIREDMPLVAYFYKIVRNNIYSFLRGKFYALQLNNRMGEAMVGGSVDMDDVESKIIADDIFLYIKKIVEQMPERRREIFILSKYHQLSYREIAERLEISENTVDVQIRKAMAFFRKNVKNKDLILQLLLFSALFE